MITQVLVKIIKIYQKTLSLDHGWLKYRYPGGYCKYSPTCSEYAVSSLTKYGAIKGTFLSLWRVLRCNPWSKGGYDPL